MTGGIKERMKNRNGTVKRIWLPGALFFFDAKKRAGTRSYNDGPWLWSRRASRGKKGHEGGGKKEKKKKSMDEASMGGELFKTDPYSTIRSTMISAVRAAHKRSRGRIIRGDFFILAAARLWGNPFG